MQPEWLATMTVQIDDSSEPIAAACAMLSSHMDFEGASSHGSLLVCIRATVLA